MQDRLRRTLSNEPVVTRRERPVLRPKLTVGPAGDRYEQEADRIAQQVMANLRRPPITKGKPAVRRQANGHDTGGGLDSGGEQRIRSAGHGNRFDDATRARMEGAFGADFGEVRVHTSDTIDTAAEGLQADAFTVGRDIYVRRSLFRPGTTQGDELLAHELTHTLQQGGSRIRRSVAAVDVRAGMPHDRISQKKRMMYLDFVRMKRYDPKYGKALQKALGFDVEEDDDAGGNWGHWWTEVGDRNPMNGEFKHKSSYGWWPKHGAGGVTGALMGVEGALNKDYDQDPHAGETGKPGLTEFHPAMEVDTDKEDYGQIRTRITNQIDTFAHGFKGRWQWKLGWGKNCHTFQQAMKTKIKLHYQKAKSWLEDPVAVAAATTAKANLDEVEGQEWHVHKYTSIGNVNLATGDDGANVSLGATKEFALTGNTSNQPGFKCLEFVTRDGTRGWLSEVEYDAFGFG